LPIFTNVSKKRELKKQPALQSTDLPDHSGSFFEKPAWRGIHPGWYVGLLLFAVFPFLHTSYSAEPENNIRYLAFAFVLILASILLLLAGKKSRYSNSGTPLSLWMLAGTIISMLSVFFSMHTGEGIYEVSKWILHVAGFFFWLILFRQSGSVFQLLISGLLLSCSLFLGYALVQCIPHLNEMINGKFFRVNDFLFSTFSNKNFFGETLLLMLPFLLSGFFLLRGYLKFLSALCLAGCLLMLILIQSLAVIIALLIATITVLLLLKKYLTEPGLKINTRVALSFSAVVLITAMLLYQSGSVREYTWKFRTAYSYFQNPERMAISDHSVNDNSIYDRLLLTKNSLQLFSEYPVTGCGIANWRILFSNYSVGGSPFLESGRLRYEHPHNDYLFLLCEMGIAGLIAWTGLLITALLLIRNKLRDRNAPRNIRLLLILMAGGIVSFMVISLFSYPRERFYSLFLLMLMLALTSHLTRKQHTRPVFIPRIYVLLLLLLLSSFTWMHAIHVKSDLLLRLGQNRQLHKDFPLMLRYVQQAKNPLFPLDITSTPLNWYEGMAYYYLGDTLAAERSYQKASEENPYHLHVWNDLGSVYEKQKRYSEALQSYYHVLDINPKYYPAHYNISVVHFKTGQSDSALWYLDRYPHQNFKPYKVLLSEVLAYAVGQYAQKQGDTALVNLLNDKIATDYYFLNKQYVEASRNQTVFIENLVKLKQP
jgi:O-antigen ligase/lipoprotein NlpI